MDKPDKALVRKTKFKDCGDAGHVVRKRKTRQAPAQHQQNTTVNPRFKFFLGLCNMKLPAIGNYLPHPHDNKVFESKCLACIGGDDCYALATMEWLGLNHMHIYMA